MPHIISRTAAHFLFQLTGFLAFGQKTKSSTASATVQIVVTDAASAR